MAALAHRLLRRRIFIPAASSVTCVSVSRDLLHGGASSFPSIPRSLGDPERGTGSPRCWWFRQPVRCGSTAVTLNTDGGFARFAVGDTGSKQKAGQRQQLPAKKKMSRKAKVNQLKWYRLKAKKKMKSPNPEVRIRYKLEKAKRKEEWLIEKLRKYEIPGTPEPVHDPEILTEEEKFYLKRTGEKKKNYVPVGRRGVFGGVILNMHLHWKKHETMKVVCKPCRPGQVYEYAEELTRLSKGTIIDIKPDNTIIFYRGKNYVQPKVMSPPDTLSKQKALEKYRYEQSLEHTSQFIEKLEKELEDFQKHVALFKNRDVAASKKVSSEDTTVNDHATTSDSD
ncbi:hypothetical protein EJB05_45121 [Eragrostis curvula]|uniref:CRM domain-containing protein n=1 Tax=Eragrostis curvula TaxID=38414 RepID=A0A5J9TJG8_9POAL|nr:hypothetical protein EJB05_45121 [Eragrostis curvula]